MECVQGATPYAESRGVRLVLDTEPLTLHADRLRLCQLVDNLLSNGVKFTPDGGTVTVRTRNGAGMGVLEVEDTGMGIPAEEQDRLFERFFRTSVAYRRSIEGTALGLVIAKAIAERHGGGIAFESRLGLGTTFRVELPQGADALADDVAA